MVRCLEKPFLVGGPSNLERETAAVYYKEVYEAGVAPKLTKVVRTWQYTYWYCYKFMLINKFVIF